MPSIIVLDTLSPDGLALLDAAAGVGVTYEVVTGLSVTALSEALARHDGAICRSGVKITAESLAGNHRLKEIVRAGVGTDNIDKEAATRQGIVVMNTPAGNTVSTAEHTFALILALSRNVAAADASLREHRWERNKFMGVQLAGKTLGIVGLGRIGQAVAKRALSFDMRVLGFDPFLSAERAAEMGIELVETVRGLLPQVDYLTVHTPLTDETRHLVGMTSSPYSSQACGSSTVPAAASTTNGRFWRGSRVASLAAWHSMFSRKNHARTAPCSACQEC